MPKNKNTEDEKGRVHRARHEESDSESSDISESVNYRALRGEEKPLEQGLQPPEGADQSKTPLQHVGAGSRAKTKSAFVSTTKSKRTAIAWAAFTNPTGTGRVAKIKATKDDMDISTTKGVKEHLKVEKGTAVNSAKASKEVLTKGGIDKSRIMEVKDVQKVSQEVARNARKQLKEGKTVVHEGRIVEFAQVSRAKATESKVKLKPHGALVLGKESSLKRENSASSLSSNSDASESSKSSKPKKKKKSRRM
ncbi:hypothetical protein [Aquimarina sp. 2201CG14-23]|uniref:hypothetical protein n=1 Tax=Aquimarina mycalae TaxID=3040073 RepID=UPI002477E318|nr:hypothetical protein [Aquimarina sp. 2201CG14-23]MDH7445656.1 hypothetical protein [Aquimarina sp. 2201CG14-23]